MAFASDLRYSLRSFARAPILTLTLVVTIAAGVGANTSIFAFVGGLMASEIASADPDAPARFARVAALLGGASALVLMLASSTVVSLLLARARVRAHEIAVRVALGASGRRLALLCLADGLVLAVAGCAVGGLAGWWTAFLFPVLFFAEDAEHLAMTPSLVWLATGIGAWLIVLLVVAMAPVLTVRRQASWTVLRRESKGAGRGAEPRTRLMMAQIGICCVLLVVAGMIRDDLRSSLRTARGLSVGSLFVVPVRMDPSAPDGARREYFAAVEEHVMALPGVARTAWVNVLPTGLLPVATVSVEPPEPRTRAIRLDVSALDPAGLPPDRLQPVAGRMFGIRDGPGTCPVAIVNEAAAEAFFAGDAVGRAVELPGGRVVEIIGVLPSGPAADAQSELYLYADQRLRAPPRESVVAYVAASGTRVAAALGVDVVSPAYFDVFADPPTAGRALTARDRPDDCRVGVVSASALGLFGGDAVGGAVIDGAGERIEIVGVVDAAPLGAAQRVDVPVLFEPLSQAPEALMTLAVAALSADDRTSRTIDEAVRSVPGGAPTRATMTLEEFLLRTALAPARIAMTLIGVLAAVALVLSIVAVHGGMADLVVARQRELSLRIALGARGSRVIGEVLRAGFRLASVGAGVGLAVALAVSPVVGALLGPTSLPGPVTLLLAATALAALVLMSCSVPAWRAVRLNPRDVLGAG